MFRADSSVVASGGGRGLVLTIFLAVDSSPVEDESSESLSEDEVSESETSMSAGTSEPLGGSVSPRG